MSRSEKSRKNLLVAGVGVVLVCGLLCLLLPILNFVEVEGRYMSESYSGFYFIFGEGAVSSCLVAWIMVLVGTILVIPALLLFIFDHTGFGGIFLIAGAVILGIGANMYPFFLHLAGWYDDELWIRVHGTAQATFFSILGSILGSIAIIFGGPISLRGLWKAFLGLSLCS